MNLVRIQELIESTRKDIRKLEKEVGERYESLRDLEASLRHGCPHPDEFRKHTVIPSDEPLAQNTEYYTCTICGQGFDRNNEIET